MDKNMLLPLATFMADVKEQIFAGYSDNPHFMGMESTDYMPDLPMDDLADYFGIAGVFWYKVNDTYALYLPDDTTITIDEQEQDCLKVSITFVNIVPTWYMINNSNMSWILGLLYSIARYSGHCPYCGQSDYEAPDEDQTIKCDKCEKPTTIAGFCLECANAKVDCECDTIAMFEIQDKLFKAYKGNPLYKDTTHLDYMPDNGNEESYWIETETGHWEMMLPDNYKVVYVHDDVNEEYTVAVHYENTLYSYDYADKEDWQDMLDNLAKYSGRCIVCDRSNKPSDTLLIEQCSKCGKIWCDACDIFLWHCECIETHLDKKDGMP